MTEKRCLVFETLGKLSDLQVMESANKNEVRLSGVFGVCGIKNQNNRIYDKENYGKMVESLQEVIKTTGCPGELEHPNSMNINLNNVSHKIESIEMNEDGTITGTILLLNTRQGQQAKAIVEGGLPLFISSRGAGTITNEGKVTLSTIKTYDLVGTPGFSEAKLTLKKNQKLECLNEGLDEGNEIWAVVEGEEENHDDSEPKEGDDKEKPSKNKGNEQDDNDDDNKNNNDKVGMKELKEAIDKLTEQVTSLQADLHVAKESIEEVKKSQPQIDYTPVETWIKEEFGPVFKNEIEESVSEMVDNKVDESMSSIASGIEKWVVEEFAPEVQNWVVEEFAPEVQNWVVEEFSPEVQNWVVEEFAPEVQNWVVEEFSPEVQNWVVEEFSPEVQGWITNEFAPVLEGWVTNEFAPVLEGWVTEEFAPEHKQQIEESVNHNVSSYLAEQSATRLDEIDNLLETIGENKTPLEQVIESANQVDDKYKGVYVVEHMPAQYAPSWKLLTEARQQEIIRSSKLHDFTKEGVLERFWANVDFNKTNESHVEQKDDQTQQQSNFFESVAKRMRTLRGGF